MEIKFTVDRLVEDEVLPEVEFKGTVTIDMPLFHIRATFPTKIGLAEYKSEKGEADEAKLKNGLKTMDMIAKGSELVMEYIKSCDLTDGDIKLSTTEELFSHPGCQEIVKGIIQGFLFGFDKKKKTAHSEPSSAQV